MDKYAVMGNPIGHSKSPDIHGRFAAQTQQNLSYEKILVKKDGFIDAVKVFGNQGGKGLNITVPFKEEAWALAHNKTEKAQRAGAVNTLKFETDGTILGENTDGIGMVKDITVNHQVSLKGKSILVMGAGGAVRGVLEPLIEQGPAQITIVNRTVTKAEILAEVFSDLFPIQAIGYDQLPGQNFQIIINGSAASLQGELPPLPDAILAEGALCYDMMYSSEPTPFMQWATQQGAKKVVDGLGMLIEQAAESFFLWRKVKPDTATVIQTYRSK